MTLFHNFKNFDPDEADPLNAELWQAYCDVNSAFVKTLIQMKKESDLIWINNIHLLLTPIYLKRLDIDANIGFYLHYPFPNSEIFRIFVHSEEILKSLLCCDVVGFHTYEYARNFYSSCEFMYKVEVTFKKGGFIVI